MGNVRVAHYLASFHKNAVFVKTRYCFICPPSLAVAAQDAVQKLARMPIFEPMSCEALKRQVSSLPFSLLLYVLRSL